MNLQMKNYSSPEQTVVNIKAVLSYAIPLLLLVVVVVYQICFLSEQETNALYIAYHYVHTSHFTTAIVGFDYIEGYIYISIQLHLQSTFCPSIDLRVTNYSEQILVSKLTT